MTVFILSQWRNQKRNKKYLEINKNGNRTYQKVWDVAKAVLKGKFTVINTYLKEQDKSQICHPTLHLTEPEKEEQMKPKISRIKEITKIKPERNGE